jgi:hypothetical protein
MTRQEIIDMAKPFLWGGNVVEGWTFNSYEQLEVFAKLIADHEREAFTAHAFTSAEKAIDVAIKLEREACAKLCDGYSDGRHANMADLCAEAIRSRGQA